MAKKRKGSALLRARKRADASAAELVETAAERIETQRVVSKGDDDLFVLDTQARPSTSSSLLSSTRDERNDRKRPGGGPARVSNEKDITKRQRKSQPSEKEQRQMKKLIRTHKVEGITAMAERAKRRPKRMKRLAGNARTNFDLWGDDDDHDDDDHDDGDHDDGKHSTEENNISNNDEKNNNHHQLPLSSRKNKVTIVPVPTGKPSMAGVAPIDITITKAAAVTEKERTRPSNRPRKGREAGSKLAFRPAVAVELAQPGQSYRPDTEQHQDAVGEALAIELRREEALQYKKTPLSRGLSDETRAILVGDSDTDDDDDESDADDDKSNDDNNDDDDDGNSFRPMKRKGKLTRAQRNKQKRVKAERVALEEKKRLKLLLHSVDDVKRYNKELRKEEAEKAERRRLLAQLREEKKAEPLGVNILEKLAETDPERVPTLPVALTSELEESNGGTLRTVKPKGNLLTERVESMVARKLAHRKHAGDRKIVVQGKKRRRRPGRGSEYLLL